MDNPSLWDIAKTFFKVGSTCWGGPAIVAAIKKESVDKKGWVKEEEFEETLSFCQMFPGPIAVQTSAHIGYRLRGNCGSFIAFFSYTLPTFIFMLFFSILYFKYERLPSFLKLFNHLQPVIVAIIVDAIFTMRKGATKTFYHILIVLFALIAFMFKVQVLYVLLLCGTLGIFILKKEITPVKGERFDIGKVFKKNLQILFFFILILVSIPLIFLINPKLGNLSFMMTKINLLAFGGGYTAVALMHQEAVVSTGYLTEKEFVNGLALGQITPGPVIITGIFIGYKVMGLLGVLLSTLYLFFPSYLLLLFFSPVFKETSHLKIVKGFTEGLIPAFIGMLLNLVYSLSHSIYDPISIFLLIFSIVMLRLKISPIFLVIISVILSAIL